MKPSARLVILAGAIGISSARVQPANLPPHKIPPNDPVSVSIYGEPDLARTVRVDSDGSVCLPLLEQKIN
jgi:protein involved in polysaccharide export with SLBB domain